MSTSAHQLFEHHSLYMFFYLYIDYLEKSYVRLKNVTTEVRGKTIFSVNSLKRDDNETTILKEVIEFFNSKCERVLEAQNGSGEKAKNTEDENFYKKLYFLLNGTKLDFPVRKTETGNDGKFTPTNILRATSGVEERIHKLSTIVKEKEAMLKEMEETHQQAVTEYEREGAKFRKTITTLQNNLKETEEILDDLTTEYGKLKTQVEKEKIKATLNNESNHKVTSTTASTSEDQTSTEESSFRAEQNLTQVPTNDIERQLHNNYKQLLLYISENLLHDHKVEFGNWAESNFSVKTSPCAYQILVELDKKGVISSSNLAVLRDFFEGITRIDLVLIIESFLAGDYSLLRSIQSTRNGNHGHHANMPPSSNYVQRLNGIHFHDRVAREQSLDPRGGLKYENLPTTTDTTGSSTVVENAQRGSGKFM